MRLKSPVKATLNHWKRGKSKHFLGQTTKSLITGIVLDRRAKALPLSGLLDVLGNRDSLLVLQQVQVVSDDARAGWLRALRTETERRKLA